MPPEPQTACAMVAEISTEPPPHRIVLPGTPIAVRHALCDLRNHWRLVGLSETLSATAEQVLAEVLNNIVEHAMPDRADGIIQLSLRTAKDCVTCGVRDNGTPLPDGILPDKDVAPPAPDPGDAPEGGFGWFLIRSLTTDLSYRWVKGWNELHFRVALPLPYEMR